jgi:hypothetical protein
MARVRIAWRAAAALGALLTASAGLAQLELRQMPVDDVQQRTALIVVYGADPCPASGPEEIIVCARRPEADRHRLPERFRENPERRVQESWAMQSEVLEFVGRQGIRSCSTVGPGGWTGCWDEMVRQAYDDRRIDHRGQPVP